MPECCRTRCSPMCSSQAVVVLFVALLSVSAGQLGSNGTRCVPEFWRNPGRFNESRSRLTFVFLFDPPFVSQDADIRRSPGVPFPCSNQRLQGVFSDVLLALGRTVPEVRDALCLYGGDDCRFDDALDFLFRAADSGYDHKFVAGSYMLLLPHRRTKHTIPSAPLFVDDMVLVYDDKNKFNHWKDAFERIFKPFTVRGWIVVYAFMISFWVCLALFIFRFAPKELTFLAKVAWVFGESGPSKTKRASVSWRLLMIAMGIFFAVLVLMYEIAVAVAIFRPPDPPVSDIEDMKRFGISSIVVNRGAASETILRNALDPEGRFQNSDPPWKRADSLAEMIDLMRNPKSGVKYIFTFRSTAEYVLNSRKMCKVASATLLNKKEVGAWFYSSTVSSAVRLEIDKAIMNVFLRRQPVSYLRRFGHCEELSAAGIDETVGYHVLLLLFCFSVLPFVLLFLLSLCRFPCCRRKENEKNEVTGLVDVESSSSDDE